VTEVDLVERLAAHRTLGSAPRAQLEWLAARATLHRFSPGEVLGVKGTKIDALYVVLSGHVAIRVDRGGGARKVMEWWPGDVSGMLPYSRLTASPGNSTAEEPTEIMSVSSEHFPEMMAKCQELTAILVHVMLDRARRFTAEDLQDEKLISLGRLSAGLAHELNNPASAVARTAEELSGCLFELEASALTLGSAGLTAEQLATLSELRRRCGDPNANLHLSAIQRADREDAVAEWMANHRLRGEIVEAIADSPLTLPELDSLARSLGDEHLVHALRSLAATCRVNRLASEVRVAAKRVHELVAAVKGFTQMDSSGSKKRVVIRQGLSDTLTVLRNKAKSKSVTVTLEAPGDLPAIDGYGGELNQVWSNLIDNAIDAAPAEGHVKVCAARQDGGVQVKITDDGPGVPEKLQARIFEPFFTTKPQGQGTGLGLDIVRRLVLHHNGQIELSSRPGCTEFQVTLPGT
jgi:signal transduction histidine kinase